MKKAIIVILVVFAVACIWFIVKYGNKPVSEMPAWMFWLFMK